MLASDLQNKSEYYDSSVYIKAACRLPTSFFDENGGIRTNLQEIEKNHLTFDF